MRDVLTQMDLVDVLLGIELIPLSLPQRKKNVRIEKPYPRFIFIFQNRFCKTSWKYAAALWLKLKQLCMIKTLTSKLYLKQRLYSHHISKGTPLSDHLTIFKEIFANLESIKVKYEEEDLDLIMLCSLFAPYSAFMDAIFFIVMLLLRKKFMMPCFLKKMK